MSEKLPFEALLHQWLAMTAGRPPEWVATYMEDESARWCVVTVEGWEEEKESRAAYLASEFDLPFWAYVLAKAYLDDLGEWPTYGMMADAALFAWEEHNDPIRAVHDILAVVKLVWPDFEIRFVGQETE